MIKINNLSNINRIDLAYIILLAIFPLALIMGNLIINLFIFIFSVGFFINLKQNKIFFQEKIFYLLVFFLISLLINVIFSSEPENSFPRVIKILFIIFFIFEIKRLIQKHSLTYIKQIYKVWLFLFLALSIDIIFEVIFGHNIFGNISDYPGRIASFFGDELVVGAFYHGFVLFFLSYLILRKSNIYTLISAIILILLISFLIGERSNFIKLFLSVVIFASLAIKVNYKLKIISFLIVITSLFIIINSNSFYKTRYFQQIKTLFSLNGYSDYMKKSQYGAHRDAAIQILKENLIFGVGVKNFRHESGKKKYENKEFKKTDVRQATHPHQIHYEFLSETGIFGYFSFLIFIFVSLYHGIKSYIKTKNLYQLSGIIFILTSLLPLLPSGSFLSTFSSAIFWLNFAIMNAYILPKS